MNLNVDTSCSFGTAAQLTRTSGPHFRKRSISVNRTAIPITNADMKNKDRIQVIANTAAFHFGTIEQGGSSLYATLSQKVRV